MRCGPLGTHAFRINDPYAVYEVLKPFDVQEGPARPWFGPPGLAIQYKLPRSVQDLIDDDFLREVS
ncbi:hypothetical protein Rhe02_51730 [Rhizocola hellebori]|uniref:TNT domain-containing protein n=1 Tax=Rhizocola hellebori TaxID=1392758 RepID=A0A8J3VII9_9ACTN|nr:hypothetical protein Rhe02_51730 [Rhizocola hellebori]